MISANGGLPAHRYTPQVTPRWPRGSEPASRLSRTQDPTKGQFNFFETPFALRQVTGRQQVYENPCECVYCVLRWVCVDAASWREGCICTCLACSHTNVTNPTKPQEPRQRHER